MPFACRPVLAASAGVLGGVLTALLLVARWRRRTARARPAGGPGLLDLPPDATVLVIGDSWTYGSAASTPTLGYAYVLAELTGWTTIVDGVRGSGYLKPVIDGPDYGTRIAALDAALDPDLVIVQGSINDRRLPAEGYQEAVDAAWDRLGERFPRARVVVLGPAPQVLPVQKATSRIDRDLAALASRRGWWYVSPVRDGWIDAGNYAEVIDTGPGNDHPSTEGHRRLAERLAAALDEISVAPVSPRDPVRRPS